MKKSKLLLFACCTALAVSSAPVYGARIPKPSVSSDKPAASVFKNTATQALDLIDLAQEERVERIGEMCRLDYAQSGVLASVTAAQCILESGYLTSELASEANNCFGMKSLLSNNDWEDSTWDGVSTYRKQTREEYSGQVVTIEADFRQYDSMEDSLADHSAYLLGARSGLSLRYEGLKDEKDPRTAIQIIKDGGHATDSSYVEKVCAIIERHDLTRFDDIDGVEVEKGTSEKETEKTKKRALAPDSDATLSYRDGYYRVRRSWTDLDDQLGAFSMLENAKSVCKPGYNVYDPKGNVVYSLP